MITKNELSCLLGMDADVQRYYTGTSGLLLPVPNKVYYPEEFKQGSRLHYYGSLMNSIEVNSSFYKIPKMAIVAKWAEDVPREFKFTFKLFKGVTHAKGLVFDGKIVEHFMEVIDAVGEKRGCLLVQFPPSVRFFHIVQLERLMDLLRSSDRSRSWKIALEFRHPSLYVDSIYELLGRYQMGMVIHDKPPAISPFMELDQEFVYLRFHGPGGSYRGTYQTAVLEEYAAYIAEWLSAGKQVYVYFNNTMGEAYANLATLRQMITNGY